MRLEPEDLPERQTHKLRMMACCEGTVEQKMLHGAEQNLQNAYLQVFHFFHLKEVVL